MATIGNVISDPFYYSPVQFLSSRKWFPWNFLETFYIFGILNVINYKWSILIDYHIKI